MPTTSKTHKQIQANIDDWKLYDRVAKRLSKTAPQKVYINTTVKIAMLEYIANHPELQIKVN